MKTLKEKKKKNWMKKIYSKSQIYNQVKRLAQKQAPAPREPIKTVRMVRDEDGEIMFVSDEDKPRLASPIPSSQFRWNRRCFDLEYKNHGYKGFLKL